MARASKELIRSFYTGKTNDWLPLNSKTDVRRRYSRIHGSSDGLLSLRLLISRNPSDRSHTRCGNWSVWDLTTFGIAKLSINKPIVCCVNMGVSTLPLLYKNKIKQKYHCEHYEWSYKLDMNLKKHGRTCAHAYTHTHARPPPHPTHTCKRLELNAHACHVISLMEYEKTSCRADWVLRVLRSAMVMWVAYETCFSKR